MTTCAAPLPSFQPVKAPDTVLKGAPLLDRGGARVIIGWSEEDFAAPIAPSPWRLFGPRGACLHPDGSLWIADTGHHRLLGWRRTPDVDNADADILIGQGDFSREGRNAKGEPTAASLNVPTGVCVFGRGLAVADAWNHRVLLWRETPRENNQPADIILGQADAAGMLANRGAAAPTAATMHWPYGVAEIAGRLAVCDAGNRRTLFFDDPRETGAAADLVLGQRDFQTRDENAGGEVGAAGMRWPHAAALWNGALAIADAGDNRILLWREEELANGAAADAVLGQGDFRRCDHNRGAYYPSASSLNMPYAIVVAEGLLIAADTANSRLVAWRGRETGARADYLAGQPDFASKGDNRWGVATRDSLCWPYGLSARGQTLAVADSGNNRVMLWELAA